jgi:malic enzyme
MAAFATEATRVTEQMFIIAAKALAEQVTDENLSTGLIYPPQSRILDERDALVPFVMCSTHSVAFWIRHSLGFN